MMLDQGTEAQGVGRRLTLCLGQRQPARFPVS